VRVKLQLLGAIDMKLSLNRVFYIPSGRVAALNLAVAVVLICFAFLLHYLPFELGETVKGLAPARDSSAVLDLCHERALRFASICDFTGLFDTSPKCFRAGLVCGK
jgi:hypothetical protein